MKKKIFLHTLALLSLTMPCSADDHGDTLSTATPVTNVQISGRLDSTTDNDIFRLDLTQAGKVFMFTTGSADTKVSLYDQSGDRLTFNDNGGWNYNGSLERNLTQGVYYLGIAHGGSANLPPDYQLHVRCPQNATPFTGSNLDASLEVKGSVEFYQFRIHTPGRTYLHTLGDTDTHLSLYDHHGQRLTFNDNGGVHNNAAIVRNLDAGLYYILIQGSSTGVPTGSFTLCIRNPDFAIPFNQANRNGSFHRKGDLDFYRLDLPKSGPLLLFTTGSTDTYLRLLDQWSQDITFNDNGGTFNNAFIQRTQAAGTYYVIASAGGSPQQTGSYVLSRRDASTAIPLIGSGSKSYSLHTPGDHDLFMFNSAGGSATFHSLGTTNTDATLMNADGSSLTYNDNGGTGSNFSISRTLSPGIHYLLVHGSSPSLHTGPYDLVSSFNSDSILTLDRPGTSADSNGTTNSLSITTNKPWVASDIPGWVSLSQTSGSGNDSITLNMAPNTSGHPRTATFNIGGTSHTVTQSNTSSDLQIQALKGIVILVPTEAGKTYRIQSSTDNNRWEETNVTITGDGSTHSAGFPTLGKAAFYRVVEN